MTTTQTPTLPAYVIDEGDSIRLPGTDIWKKVYRVEDAGDRYEANPYSEGRIAIHQIRFHYNAPPRSGLPGFLTVDYETQMVTNHKMEAAR